ncbi:MAG: SMI1/KNR4 family protein [Planctomycetes bacterium]|nr:SMI1/KNR4 family protein [Planctomycetota bacterium]
MFEWLVDEMMKVHTRKFYRVDGPLRIDNRELVERSELPIPPSYKSFILQFGNASLYRIGDLYRVQVFASPCADETEDGEPRLCFGRTEDTFAYFKESLIVLDAESPVFEWHYEEEVEKQTANGFEEWIRRQCARVRKYYTKKEWQEIEKGPPAFSDHEKRIVEARRKFRWRIVGIGNSGDIRFEVCNGSEMVLPFLSIGIRGRMRSFDDALDGGYGFPSGQCFQGTRR